MEWNGMGHVLLNPPLLSFFSRDKAEATLGRGQQMGFAI
jgi:hypothetical protein